MRGAVAAALLAGLAALPAAQAAVLPDSLRFCDLQASTSAAQKDRLLRFAAIVQSRLEASGQRIALLSRSGLALDRFGHRYSHAGLSLRASANGPWSVRQLYYACDEARPRLFDQGLAGFTLGIAEPDEAYLSAVLLPAPEAAALERIALDNAGALQLLGAQYSANAHAWATLYQNCNQWVAELMALAWGRPGGDAPVRERAQRWLADAGYTPSAVAAGPVYMLAAVFVPWLHRDDHPEADLQQGVFRLSLPQSLEQFVRQHQPGAERLEFCQDGRRAVVRRGWTPIAAGCVPAAGDEVIALD
ncbi:MAG: DUF2145 domain-containing protein [Rubrivivax sp.]